MTAIIDQLLVIEEKMDLSGEFEEAYQLLLKLQPQLEKMTLTDTSSGDYYLDWVFYFRRRIDCEQRMGLPVEATTRDMIERLGLSKVSKDVLFSNDSVILREQLRAVYTYMAEYELKSGKLDLAIQSIDNAFKIKSSYGEYKDPFMASYETQNKVYRAASLKDPVRYQNAYLKSLQVLKKKVLSGKLQLKDPSLRDRFNSKGLDALKANDSVEQLRRGPKVESWMQALKRLTEASAQLFLKPEEIEDDEEPMLVLETLKPELESTLQGCEKKYNVSIPKELRDCLLTHGAFRVNECMDWDSFRLYSSEQYDSVKVFAGLVETIYSLWGDRPEFEESFTANEIKFLNDNYFSFGHYKFDDNAYKHLFFDRQKKFGDIYYNQDDWGDAEDLFRKLLKSSTAKYTFSAEIVSCVDDIIEKLIKEKEERDNTYYK